MVARLTPFDVAFGSIAAERFPALRQGLTDAGRDGRDREAFVLVREVVELLREIGPEEGLGEGVSALVALTHAGYLYWADGECVVTVDQATLEALLRSPSLPDSTPALGRAYYLQVPRGKVWGEAVAGAAPEPLDGCFVLPQPTRIETVAVFGMNPARDGFTVVQASGPRAQALVREDRTALFSPELPGGAEAGLHQIVGEEELVELVYRCHGLLPPDGAAPGPQQVSFG